jgi:hypothetical protein
MEERLVKKLFSAIHYKSNNDHWSSCVGQKLCPHLAPPRIGATLLLAPAESPPKYGDNAEVLGNRFFLFGRRI